MRRPWIPIAIGLLSLTLGCGRHAAGDRVMDPPTIRTAAEASDYLAKAESLSRSLLEKAAKGESLTDPEKDNLREAANIFKGVRAYDPTKFGAYFAEGKVRYAVEEYDEAFKLMQQAIVLAPPPQPPPPLAVIQTIAEAHYVSSRCLFFMGRFAEAAEAAKLASTLAPSNPDYMTARASALLEVKSPVPAERQADENEAKVLVVKSLGRDPEHKDALRLAKFLGLR